ncbi:MULTISPECIES: hypothetical protein [unclassified Rhizobium]|uniref:hypothetical protein n=1 Tax=unclassified Rhizobium TaxID=2613769 RepID=UPI000EA843AB|nr:MULTISPECIES: hypothetical protein [unclassified Rhizobium]AYG67888.1 hypothetical protein CCGE531_19030 [Rhizobium sp. CCGE531]AYG74280.1 hypothetical protein CCGE532_18525 [Rhizobium sp. CCGE532]
MFFMGGMTMGYLQPPVPAKQEGARSASLSDENSRRQSAPAEEQAADTSAIERSLIWARRILC